MDFPTHVIATGNSSSAYSIEHLIGSMQVVEIPEDGHVTPAHVESLSLKDGDIIFFKTANSRRNLHDGAYTETFAAIDPAAAELLVTKGAKIVGIDYLSVDRFEDEALPSHQCLLSNDILIIENLDLRRIPAGKYQVVIAPLKVKEADGLPVRVIAGETGFFSVKKKRSE